MNVKLMLDASRENDCPEGFLAVESEIEFLRLEVGEQSLFVRGEQLCHWVRELCRARGLKEGLAFFELPSPRDRLRHLIGDLANSVQIHVLTRAVEILKQSPSLTCGELLARLAKVDFWSEMPSREHAARWLLAEFSAELEPLVEATREFWVRGCEDEVLSQLYKLPLTQRQAALKEWFNIEDELVGLGLFPVAVEDDAADALRNLWGQKLRQTSGQALEKLSMKNPNAALIANEAYDYFCYRQDHLTLGIVARIGSMLSPLQRSHLERLVPREVPESLPINASEREALSWAEQYLSYRGWQVSAALDEATAVRTAEELAESFADWLLEHYPGLTTKSIETSPLNIRAKYLVNELSQSYRVLWVVVDGLNYLNHRRLMQLLANTDAALSVEQDYKLLAVLPTITEKAKYGMTSGLLPRQNVNGEWDIRKVLSAAFPHAQYAGETQEDKLKAALADQSVRICYWNMTAVDGCYHTQTDPDAIHDNIGARLDALAKGISRLVMASANPDHVAVVISTDHGQMLGPCFKHEIKLKETGVHGRTAKGNPLSLEDDADQAYVKADDGSAVLLNPTRYQLSEPTTLALKSYHFGGWSKDSQGRAWGVHGGLSPEEVVVGLSVLRRKHQQKPVTVSITGVGEVGKLGRMTLSIDNPNPAQIRLLTLMLKEVDEYRLPLTLNRDVDGLSQFPVELELQKFPSPSSDEQLSVTGTLSYEFSDGVHHECAVTGTLICKQMYIGQRPSLRDRIKK